MVLVVVVVFVVCACSIIDGNGPGNSGGVMIVIYNTMVMVTVLYGALIN